MNANRPLIDSPHFILSKIDHVWRELGEGESIVRSNLNKFEYVRGGALYRGAVAGSLPVQRPPSPTRTDRLAD